MNDQKDLSALVRFLLNKFQQAKVLVVDDGSKPIITFDLTTKQEVTTISITRTLHLVTCRQRCSGRKIGNLNIPAVLDFRVKTFNDFSKVAFNLLQQKNYLLKCK